MAKFRIAGPDGASYDVVAPEGVPDATVMEYVQKSATMDPVDLSVARSKNDDFGAFLRAQAEQPKEGETPEQTSERQYGGISGPEVGTGEGLLRGALQGASFGTGDEVVAAGAAGLNKLTGKDEGREFGELYDAYLAGERGKIDQFRKDSPVAAYGSEIVGAIPTAVITAPAGGPATLGGRVVQGAATGAGQGATYGFAAGEGGLGERAKSAALGGTAGGVIGAAAPVIGAGVRNVAERVKTGQNAKALGMPRAAYNTIMRAAAADDTLTGEGARRVAKGGPDAMLADAGPNMRGLLDVSTQKSGAAATTGRKAVEQRVSAAAKNVTTALDDALGRPQGVKTTETALRKGTAAARGSAYDAAYSQPIDYSTEVGKQIEGVVSSRVPMSAIRKANEMMRIEGLRSQQILASVADDGTITFKRLPDVRQLDYITRGLQEVADRASGQGKIGGTTDTGRLYGNLKSELRGLVRQAVPQYAEALETAADPISKRAALKLGQKALSARIARDELAEELAGMSGVERSYVAQGIRAQLDEALANVKRAMTDGNMDAREAIKALQTLSSRGSREKIETVIGPEQASRLFNALDEATGAYELRAAIAENSKTFARQSLDDAIRAQTDDGWVNALRSGEVLNMRREGVLPRMVQALAGRTAADKERAADATYNAIADALTRPRGPAALNQVRTMEGMQQMTGPTVERARILAERLMGANTGVTGPAMQRLPAK